MKRLFANLTEEIAKAYGLVLSASDIPFKIESTDRISSIDVDPQHRSAACRSIARYLKNNKSFLENKPASLSPATYNTLSAVFVALVLVAVHWSIGPGDVRLTFVRSFGADASQILAGNLFRCVTALLLHTDTLHLLSNVFGIVIFGTAVVYHCGWGVGWLMILLAGAAGNWMTAGWYQQAHLSIGSSTVVFAAVGLSAALMSRIYAKRYKRSWRSWTPVAGGMALMGMMGVAPHTDLVAHFFGFVSGLLFGLIYNRWFRLVGQPFQLICAIVSAQLVVGCCIWGWVQAHGVFN
jgi:membrane associated rhomboid family serine protease